jgi:hypothetical protein
MLSTSKLDYGYEDKHFTKIDFGMVPVGSVHKRSIDITNELKASLHFCFQLIKQLYL